LTLEEELDTVTAKLNPPVPSDELARRRIVIEGIRTLREEIGSIGIPVTALIRDALRKAGDLSHPRSLVDSSVVMKWLFT
jgi:hypothetical protein